MLEDSISEKIIRCCGDVQSRIHACRTRQIACMLKDRLCQEFAQDCVSELIRQLIARHIDELIADTFDRDGNNKYLEEE